MSETNPENVGKARILIVPPTPGTLIDPEAVSKPRAPDEIEEVISDLFGPDPGGSPGWLDAVLLSGGLGLILWAELALHSTGVTVVGAIIAFLGSIFPIRSTWRSVTRWRRHRRRAAVMSRGLALNMCHPLTRQLVDAHDALLEAAKLDGIPFKAEAVSAAHLAVIESASLLDEAEPSTAAEAAYVEKRIEAIRKLTHALRQQHGAWLRAEHAQSEDEQGEMRLERTARVQAGEELDAIGISSLHELDDLVRLAKESSRGSRS